MKSTHPAKSALIDMGQRYPRAWKDAEYFRSLRAAKDIRDWPEWCYLPLGGWYAIISKSVGVASITDVALLEDIGALGALGAWRMTQGIYRFDQELYKSVIDTPINGSLPCELLMRLPEWCVYIETPGLQWTDTSLHGVWAHLEKDDESGRTELRLVSCCDTGLHPIALHLGDWTLQEAADKAIEESIKQAQASGIDWIEMSSLLNSSMADFIRDTVTPVVSLLLYLCIDEPDISRNGKVGKPANPQPKKVKKGWRTFASNGLTEWDVGVRMGAALKSAYARSTVSPADGNDGEGSVRSHVRRAHWHTFLSGKRKDEDGNPIPSSLRQRDLRWMPPIAVAVGDYDSMPAVIKPVSE